MNSSQAKKLSLPNIMSRLGYEPVKSLKSGAELWYVSPFRDEKEASFHTSFLGGKWIWKDFGDTGGTVIDFIIRHENYTSVKDALGFLRELHQKQILAPPERVGEVPKKTPETKPNLFSFQQQARAAVDFFSNEPQLKLIEVITVQHPAIFQYLGKERLISHEIVEKYLVEVRYRNLVKQKDYFAFGMLNQSNGYEIRAASSSYPFKSSLNGRDISIVKGTSPQRATVNIFEGMTDFLSLLVMYRTTNLAGDSIILHSLSSFKRAVDYIEKQDYKAINTFLDNDVAGKKETEKFRTHFPNLLKNQSDLFLPHNDLNEALLANQTDL